MGLPALLSPEPIDPAYKPSTSITSIPADSPIEDILEIIERDGGVILTGFATQEEVAAVDRDVAAHGKKTRTTEKSALHIIPKETLAVPGLVGKSDTMARICSESPVLEQLRTAILQDRFTVNREDVLETNVIDPLLSISMTFYIGHGAPRQRLHRDDNIHGTRHPIGQFDLKKAGQFACLIAGSRTTRENGATMFIPGSHRWDDTRVPQPDEICFAEMQPGSALIFLASCYHGGGHNSVPGEVRKVHGLFFVRGTMRTEENQFLAVPRSKVLTMNDKMLSLLGYKKPTTVLGVVDNEDPALYLQRTLEMANQ
jgi:ectoine hydroxylase-related dioxygenase (phytanoyl-CoA dioxygenase family)